MNKKTKESKIGKDEIKGIASRLFNGSSGVDDDVAALLAKAGSNDEIPWRSLMHNALLGGCLAAVRLLASKTSVGFSRGPLISRSNPYPEESPLTLRTGDSEWTLTINSLIHMGKVETIRFMQSNGWLEVDREVKREAALTWATSKRLPDNKAHEMLTLLMEIGVDFCKDLDYSGTQPLTAALLAKERGRAETLLLEGIHEPKAKSSSPLPACISNGWDDLVNWLLETGENPNKKGPNQGYGWFGPSRDNMRLPLVMAMELADRSRGDKLAHKLIEAGAKLNLADVAGSAMEVAERRGLGMLLAMKESSAMEQTVKQGSQAAKKKAKAERKAAREKGEEVVVTEQPVPLMKRRRI